MTSGQIVYILSIISCVVRDYLFPTHTTKAVYKAVLNELAINKETKDMTILDKGKNIVSVDGELFKVFKPANYNRFDCKHVGHE